METETLSSYEQAKDKHVLEDNDNMDETSIKRNESDLHPTKICEDSSENANDDIDSAGTNHRTESENNENESESPINTATNEQEDNEEVASDEEEDVPLNLEGSKSDNENLSDDDLDDLDTFQNEDQIDSDKEEIDNGSSSPSKEIESTSGGVDDQAESEKDKNHVMDSGVVNDDENEDIIENNSDIVEQLQAETEETDTDLQSDPLANEESDPLLVKEGCIETGDYDTNDKTNNKYESHSQDKEDIAKNDENENEKNNEITNAEQNETTPNDKSKFIEETEEANNTTESDNDKITNAEQNETTQNDKSKFIEKTEEVNNTTESDNDKITNAEQNETTENDKSNFIEKTEEANNTTESDQINTDESDPLDKKESDSTKSIIDSTSPEIMEHGSNNEEHKDAKEKSVANVESTTETLVESGTDFDKNDIENTTEDPLALESKSETEQLNQRPDEVKDKDNNREGIEDNLNCPLLKETLSKPNDSKQTEGDDDIDMDDDFDPSLLCPDIAMEVDEAPVITSNHEDSNMNSGNKSPLLYEPIFSTFVDEVTGAEVSFDLTPEEEQIRQDTYGQRNPVHLTKIHCTACNIHLGSALDGQGNRFVHPLLKVLICKKCYHFYTSGEFEKDEDGSELYCRWCGQGGQVMCCANCEMVFCKKCIRINFDRKKINQIKDSDDWLCFRCHPSQITHLKLHCAEFMEYVRRETSRIATLENAAEYMKIDHCRCCLPQKKKVVPEPNVSQPPKKKRKMTTDPDYDPFRDRASPQPSTSGFNPDASQASKSINITPKETDPNKNGGIVQINKSVTTPINLFKPRNPTSLVRPRAQGITPGAMNSSNTGFVKIAPGGVRLSGSGPTTKPITTNFSARAPVRPNRVNNNTNMKHEWFEKTVRAAARVNSNLSYTLTQLNRAQATASSVEALAVVHNKLQEILSTSINSLIQIRKNLRTEFIQGIKNIRFPAKPTPTPPPPPPPASSSAQDDDVIFISPSSSPVPPPLTPTVPSMIVHPSPPPLFPVLGPEVSLTKNKSPVSTITKPSNPVATTSKVELERPKTFLRVKSLTALQNVPSECITIPDDPPPLVPVNRHNDDDVTIIEDTPEDSQLTNGVSNGEHHKEINEKDSQVLTYTADNLEQPHSKELKRIMRMTVLIHRSPKIDKMVRNLYGCVNGNASK